MGLEGVSIMTKLLGMLLCASACLLLGLGATGCTKKTTTTDKKVETSTTTKNPDNTTTKTTKVDETKTEKTEQTKKLMLKAPADATIKQGDTAKVNVAITREHYTDPVEVKLTDLPTGVTVEGTPTIAKDATSADVTLKASPDAKVVENHKVKVWAGSDAMKQESSFKLTVKAK
jgi:hypothetical protein